MVGEGESGQHKVFLSSRVVLPEILGSLSIINGTSAGFSRKGMPNSQNAKSEQTRKSVFQIWSVLVWTRSEVGVDSFWSALKGPTIYYLANAAFPISVISKGSCVHYEVDWQPRALGRRWFSQEVCRGPLVIVVLTCSVTCPDAPPSSS